MAHPFEIAKDLEVEASPQRVWEAIATGPGQDSWFMGRSEIEPREGGAARWSIGDFTMESTVTACISQMGLKSRAVRSSTSTPGPAAFLGTASRMGGCAMRSPVVASKSTYRSACPSPLDCV